MFMLVFIYMSKKLLIFNKRLLGNNCAWTLGMWVVGLMCSKAPVYSPLAWVPHNLLLTVWVPLCLSDSG